MAATSLKLPDELKRRIAQLVAGSDRAHSFMVEAIEQATERKELRRRFGEEAALAEEETERSGKVYDAVEVFRYFEAHVKGGRARKPRPKSWRRSG